MGLTWAALWAVFGIGIGVSSRLLPSLPWHLFFDVFDAPLPALAVPGFFGGALFSIVLGIAARNRRFDELSLPKFTVWGAIGGLLLSLLPNALNAVGLAELGSEDVSLWKSTLVISPPFMIFSAASAAISLLIAKRAEGSPLASGQSPELNGGRAPYEPRATSARDRAT